MHFAIVKGSVVATQKTPTLKGIALKLLQVTDQNFNPVSKDALEMIVAIDAVGARLGDRVMWVGKREASLAIPGAPLANGYPVDAAVTGIIDDIS